MLPSIHPPARILYCEGNVDGTIGGSYYSLLFLLEGLDRARVDSLLILRRDTPLLPRFERAAGEVRIIERSPPFQIAFRQSGACRAIPLLASALGVVQSGVNVIRFYAKVVSLASLIRRERVRLVHLNNSVTSNHDWMLAAMLARVPCVTHERGLNDHYSTMARWCAPRLAAILCISQAVFDKLIEKHVSRDNLRLVPNGLNPATMTPGRGAEETRRAFGIADGHRVIGLIGNIREWKGQEVVVRALPIILQQFPHLTCLFVGEASVGDRSYMDRLESLIQQFGIGENVVFTGYCANVADALNVMDVSIHASVAPEPFGRVLLEAMAMKKPIVGSSGGAVSEIVKDGVTGYTFLPGDPKELAARVIDLLDQPERSRAFGEAGYQRLVSQFQLTTNVARTMAVYSEVAGLPD